MNDIIIGMLLGVIIVWAINSWTARVISKIPQDRLNKLVEGIFNINNKTN